MVRDWPGLAILFVMPAVLLIVITLIQENAVPSKNTGISVIIVNKDSSLLGNKIVSDLTGSGYFSFSQMKSVNEAETAIHENRYQLAVIIPDSCTEKLYNLPGNGLVPSDSILSKDGEVQIEFLYSPALQPAIRNAIQAPLRLVVQLSAAKILVGKYSDEVNAKMIVHSKEIFRQLEESDYFKNIPDFPFKKQVTENFRKKIKELANGKEREFDVPATPEMNSGIVRISEQVAAGNRAGGSLGALQNNVPAFTLFAMFFIVIPLAGSIINEKINGTFSRLRTFPVTFTEILTSKIIIFFIICIIQFIVMLLIGVFILPKLGEEAPINLNINWFTLAAALAACSLAATGFGLITGSYAANHGQAATFGSVMVVILAMLGGIFVPPYMLPGSLKAISTISPLRWGTDALLGIFTGDGRLLTIIKELCLMTGFFLACLLLSVKTLRRD